MSQPDAAEGRRRVVIENVQPVVDGGRFPAKRVVGDLVTVAADVFADGHDEVRARLRWRHEAEADWHAQPMLLPDNDRWTAAFPITATGDHHFTVEGWVDPIATWVRDLRRRVEGGQDVVVELEVGATLLDDAATRAIESTDAARLTALALYLRDATITQADRVHVALDARLLALADRWPDLTSVERSAPEMTIAVDRERAMYSTWYELFPRSASPVKGQHGTFHDAIERLPYVAGMGFDVLYLPPIHPIGTAFRKGPNNVLTAGADDPGAPWAIGSAEGGHTAIHPDLGTLDDLQALIAAAHDHGMEVALDIAFQASPDHPWVTEHTSWFRHRPDGTIRYAENPPKRYQDIYPFDFDSDDWQALWEALLGVMTYWAGQGVRILRVDNPHTKPFAFWAWAIARFKAEYPDVILLAEAFTRPKVMYRLAKLGFTQSYTYFTWRTTKAELMEYFTELMTPPVSDFFRPNLWPNTPDILHESLQSGGQPAFEARLVLAATLSASYGIYGPAFELMHTVPREAGSEEYLHSEKYELRHWDVETGPTLAPLITRVNEIRRAHPALQRNDGLAFHPVSDEALIAYSKRSADGTDTILVVVNLDPAGGRSGTVELDLMALGLAAGDPFDVTDLLDGTTYRWSGASNYVELTPSVRQAHVFEVRRR